MPQGAGGALEHAGIGQVKHKAFGLERTPGLFGLLDAGGRQVDVGPAGKAVFQVPGGFTMADENKLVHRWR